ncbi:hypothetical protein K2173_017707 [Erythroxylum novogranatense]|uniref:EF-hand domain-containing protein n=1 Tax=Erythroxylum novogranatense TaxID=1862640 RepID=A0AAV8SLI0_9ROSI|nr:hypothetical protein K2173_017707 [Erythroxylum novogranatense]
MVTTLLILLLLFVAGLISIYSYAPSKKINSWLQSLFYVEKSTAIPVEIGIPTSKVAIARREMSAKKKSQLKSVFAVFDKNGDGFITKSELRESLKNIRIFMTEKEVEEVVVKVDSDGDGLINFEEFCRLCESMGVDDLGRDGERTSRDDATEEGDGSKGDLKEAFDAFDQNKDGLISVDELDLVLSSMGLKHGKSVEDLKGLIMKVDTDGDGLVNFDEFEIMMRGGGKLVSTS